MDEELRRKRGRAVGEPKAKVDQVIPGSIADELGLEKGDTVLAVNGQQPRDLIDYRYMCAEDSLELQVVKENGEVWDCDIAKEIDEDLGLRFAQDTFDGIRNCVNKCIFCFVDQMPPDMRESLYVKDDDYRMSFLHGNFVTLTNLTKRDMDRIVSMRISPLYVSVHCTNPELREQMLGSKKAGRIMEQLTMLAQAGIDMHTQIVLCPGINDGDEMVKSISNLSSLWPHVKSIALVPLGLTRYRRISGSLRRYKPDEARSIVGRVEKIQREFIRKYKTPLVYLGDEFYVLAEQEFPPAEHYGEYPQLENGVGMVRLFYDSFAEEADHLPGGLASPKKVALVTGTAGVYVLQPVIERLKKVKNLELDLIGVENRFFGSSVTVAGLLTGCDVIDAIKPRLPYDLIMLPSTMCKKDQPLFLDGSRALDMARELKTPVRIIDINEGAAELIAAVIE